MVVGSIRLAKQDMGIPKRNLKKRLLVPVLKSLRVKLITRMKFFFSLVFISKSWMKEACLRHALSVANGAHGKTGAHDPQSAPMARGFIRPCI